MISCQRFHAEGDYSTYVRGVSNGRMTYDLSITPTPCFSEPRHRRAECRETLCRNETPVYGAETGSGSLDAPSKVPRQLRELVLKLVADGREHSHWHCLRHRSGGAGPLILARLTSSKYMRRREVSRVLHESDARNWAAKEIVKMQDPAHRDSPIVWEALKEHSEYIRAGKWRRRWLSVWAWVRGF